MRKYAVFKHSAHLSHSSPNNYPKCTCSSTRLEASLDHGDTGGLVTYFSVLKKKDSLKMPSSSGQTGSEIL